MLLLVKKPKKSRRLRRSPDTDHGKATLKARKVETKAVVVAMVTTDEEAEATQTGPREETQGHADSLHSMETVTMAYSAGSIMMSNQNTLLHGTATPVGPEKLLKTRWNIRPA